MKKYIYLIFAVLTSIPPVVVNWNAFEKGYQPLYSGAIVSLLFILIWFLYGAFSGWRKNRVFLLFVSIYWGIGYLTYVVCLALPFLLPLIILVILYFGPMYGVKYFIPLKPDISFITVTILIVWMSSIVGYFLGGIARKIIMKKK